MSNKTIISIIILTALIFGGGGFFGGMKYSESKSSSGISANNFQNFANLSPEERTQRFQQMGVNGNRLRISRNSGQVGQGFTNGEIISKDDKSITIKQRDGSTKIIFYSDATEVDKFVNGAAADLETGKSITITGQANQDGSITAQTIQIRP